LKGTFLPRVNFAFLDGAHNWSSLRHEIDYLASRQVKGDIIVFDDYTPEVYPGVVKAVNYLKHTYEIEILGNNIADFEYNKLNEKGKEAF
jgi:signal peptidase I